MTGKSEIEALMQSRRIAARRPEAHPGLIHLQARLEAARITQKELAERLHYTRAAVNSWCCCRNAPKVTMLPAIANALGCTIQELFIPPHEDEIDELDESFWPKGASMRHRIR